MELLRDLGKIPEFAGSRVDYVVCAYSPDLYGAACSISSKLRECGWSVDLMPTPKKKVKSSFTYADQCQARRMVFVAPDEIERGVVRVKDLRTKDQNGEAIQVDVPLDAIHTVDALIIEAAAAAIANK
jgi:histidyl-tRNA synthetase